MLEGAMQVAFNFNGCNRLEQNNFNSIAAMKINVIFEFNVSNSSSNETNLKKKHHQPSDFTKSLTKVAS